ncbi:MAG: hypothetical protein IT372_26500 [Polyangiaceae bacterium]|nr:hypothetical protein [Polyangiaceae bacterium]
MRTQPTRLLFLGTLGLASCLLVVSACSDSIHLDPQPAPTGSGGFGVGGGGGGAPVACISSSDCPAPTSVCDTVKRICVECLEHSDCAFRPHTVCSEGECRCPEASESFCDAVGTPPVQDARCVDLSASPDDCGACGHACFGACNAGACADPWEKTSLADAPSPRAWHAAVWTGSKMIVWGGRSGGTALNTGGLYDLATNTWEPISTANAPSPRWNTAAVWTGSKMIVWGGATNGDTVLGDGGIFDPVANTWAALSPAPISPRRLHAAVWTGSKMIVWGGWDNAAVLQDGAIYDPASDSWTAVDLGGAPQARREHTAVWAGNRMLVFGGVGVSETPLNDGAVYDVGGGWTSLPAGNAPSPRAAHTAVWTGSDMLVWGGNGGGDLDDGREFNLISSTWADMNPPSPSSRSGHTAVWIESNVNRMMVWGGNSPQGALGSGGLYDPVTNTWGKPMPNAPLPRVQHTAVVAGAKVIIWGGNVAGGPTNTGGVFNAAGTGLP